MRYFCYDSAVLGDIIVLTFLRIILIIVFILITLGFFAFGVAVIRASGTEANLPVGLIFFGLGILTARGGLEFFHKTGSPPPPPYVPPN